MKNSHRSHGTILNYRRILKNTVRNAQKNFPNASIEGSVSEWFARNRWVENVLALHGMKGDFFTANRILDVRNEQGKEVKSRMLKRLSKAARRQGKLVDLGKLSDFWIVGGDVRMMKFVDGIKKAPIFNVNRAIKFNSN